ncbi:Holliday junction branch migration protein RuvA [Desulfurispira natronophila]|uniref:Holliday junction branch migration complex subunit RuvA n=1 Tax=Desulfurispira natronophila TaxID=682562 RepID=A0A7W8DHK8_9BACT|nr:Holliday junction DNA helicase RuvA [Desulfurispira natronophila]
MIARLVGTIAQLGADRLILMTSSGVGYELHIPSALGATLAPGSEVELPVHLLVREDALTLYGFRDEAQKESFLLLLKVSGVGARIALATLDTCDSATLAQAISQGDTATIQRIPGVGRKLAEKIVLELKDKIPATCTTAADSLTTTSAPASSGLSSAIQALVSLGVRRDEAERQARLAMEGGLQREEEIIRHVLKQRGKIS